MGLRGTVPDQWCVVALVPVGLVTDHVSVTDLLLLVKNKRMAAFWCQCNGIS